MPVVHCRHVLHRSSAHKDTGCFSSPTVILMLLRLAASTKFLVQIFKTAGIVFSSSSLRNQPGSVAEVYTFHICVAPERI
mmetsp:Transcript_115685/g.211885  ORF Transcript_115685/g.211885 Transcript_115685/m.211885 type:complete len:80 (-) Transcript_115685:15-254(-)